MPILLAFLAFLAFLTFQTFPVFPRCRLARDHDCHVVDCSPSPNLCQCPNHCNSHRHSHSHTSHSHMLNLYEQYTTMAVTMATLVEMTQMTTAEIAIVTSPIVARGCCGS
jgi:hypothetical protein